MKTEIKNLKKNDLFIFNNQIYKVKRKFKQWLRNDDAFLEAINTKFLFSEKFYTEDLQVETLTNK